MHDIPERNWKIFRRLHAIALERCSEQFLAKSRQIIAGSLPAHEQCVELLDVAEAFRKAMRQSFSDFRRSTALLMLGTFDAQGWLTEEELSQFGPETQDYLARIRGIGRR